MRGNYRIALITSAILSLCVFGMRAETHYKPHISVGAHGGADWSRVEFSPAVKQGWVQGYTGGISVRYAEEKLVGILAELNFVQRGWQEDFEIGPLEYSRTMNCVSLPVMTHVYFGPKRLKFFFNLGPEFTYMFSQSTASNFDYSTPLADPNWPGKKRMTEQMTTKVSNRYDYGICGGFGCEFWLKPRHSIYIEGRYYFGLGNNFPSSKADTFSASRNMTITATIGYNFRVK